MSSIITASQAKNQFAEIVNRVVYQNEEFIVQKQGKSVVRIGPVQKKTKTKNTGTQFLLDLAKIKAKGLPKDLSTNLDSYAWD